MSYGLLLHNSSGDVLINGEYSNYSLIAAGTLSVAVGGTSITFPDAATRPIVFARLQSTDKFVALSALSQTAATFVMYGTPSIPTVNPRTEVAGTVEYRVFGLASAIVPSGGYGLQLFNAAGVLVYDSNVLSPRVRQVLNLAVARPVGGTTMQPTTTAAHTTGSSPWILLNPTLAYYGDVYLGSGSTMDLYRTCVRSDAGGTVSVSAALAAVIGVPFGVPTHRWPAPPLSLALIE